jgi:hypothetical protein
MKETKVAGVEYSIGRLDAFGQANLLRRLSPIIAPLAVTAKKLPQLPTGQDGERDVTPFLELLAGPLAEALSGMEDEQFEKIIFPCLSVVKRKSGAIWAPVKVAGANRLMFEDIDGMSLLQLAFEVIQENLASFFPSPQVDSQEEVGKVASS